MVGLKEATTQRILREMREKDALFNAARGLRTSRSSVDDLFGGTNNSSQSLMRLITQGKSNALDDAAMKIALGHYKQQAPGARAGTSQAERKSTGVTVIGSVSDLGPLIRKSRKAMKMNQAEFAAHAGVGRRFLSELEGGKPSLEFDKVLACAEAAGVSLFASARHN